jgi:hypothetical protein
MRQLLQDAGLAPDRHFTGPFSINPQAKQAPGSEGQIDQLDPELVTGKAVGNDNWIMRFGARHTPFYSSKTNNVNEKSMTIVRDKISVPVHGISI